MKYLFTLLLTGFIALSFMDNKCEHVFTQVEQPEIKIEEPKWSRVDDLMPPWTKWPSGKREGVDLICVKCFHQQRQVLDYGKPEQTGPTLISLGRAQSSQINAGPWYDSLFTNSAGGRLKVDSCFIIHTK